MSKIVYHFSTQAEARAFWLGVGRIDLKYTETKFEVVIDEPPLNTAEIGGLKNYDGRIAITEVNGLPCFCCNANSLLAYLHGSQLTKQTANDLFRYLIGTANQNPNSDANMVQVAFDIRHL